MNEQCPRCQNVGKMIDVHGHYQCSVCGSVIEDCCNGEICSPKKQKTFFLKVKVNTVEGLFSLSYDNYFEIEADTLSEAKEKATEKVYEWLDIEIEEYQPEEDNCL